MLNDYFDYIETLLNDDVRIAYSHKKEIREFISFFKVTGYVDKLELEISNYDSYNLEVQLYVLFEYLSMKLFKVKTYTNWLKDYEN